MKAKSQKRKAGKSKNPGEAAAESRRDAAAPGDKAGSGKATVQKAARPAVKKAVEKKGSESAVKGLFSKFSQFLREAKAELKKVKWPTRKELLASTAVVIVLSLLVAFYLGLVDFGLIKIIKLIVG